MFLDLFFNGGHLVWLLMGCSILAFIIFIERFLYFHRVSVDVSQLLEGLANLIRRKNFSEALQQCTLTPGPAARVMHSALMRHDYPREYLRDVVQEAGQLEVPRVERSLRVLLTIAYVAPLIGLLGTLLGLIDTFENVKSGAAVAAPLASGGVYQSLITSATGLLVAIPAYIFYSFLASRAKNLLHDIERGGIEIVNLIEDSRHQQEIIEFASPKKEVKFLEDSSTKRSGQKGK